jgi:hypothetical protein
MIAKFTDQHEAQAFQDLMQDKAGAARYEVRRLTKSRRNLKHQDIT